ncbi:MAG: NUDIX domain-containing protein, partial [Pseudohongiellaceae bacterium]
MKRVVHVAVGVVVDPEGKVLIALRPEQAHQGGLWEFPGGKCEPGEPVEVAL